MRANAFVTNERLKLGLNYFEDVTVCGKWSTSISLRDSPFFDLVFLATLYKKKDHYCNKNFY
jgi:hypothetical protein